MDETRQQLSSKQNQLSDTTNLLSQLPLKASIKLAELNQQLSDIDQQILETGGRRTYTLRAPSSGRVTAIQANFGHRVNR